MNDIFVFDDIVPDWLYGEVLNNISSIPVTYGHQGLGPYQGHSLFSKVWPKYELANVPWFFKSVFSVFEHNKSRLGNVTNIRLSQCQLNISTKTLNGGLHVDCNPLAPAWTMIHLIAGDSGIDFWTEMPEHGGTKIHEVDYKDNRCVLFPSKLLHRGLPPINIEPRVTVGYIFSGTPPTPFADRNNIIFPIFKDEYDKITTN